jgi:hypothetical protein
MVNKSNKYTNYISMFLLAVIVGGCGFYFGFKIKSNQDSDKIFALQQEQTKLKLQSETNEKIVIKEVEAVHWIKINKDPICPPTHPIKGVFKTDKSLVYLPSNKSYAKINPDVCFVNEDYATQNAGFIKKF